MGFIASLKGVLSNKTKSDKEDGYQPDLIQQLVDDHAELLALDKKMKMLAEREDYIGLRDVLREFKRVVDIHIMAEDTQLYTYLEKKCSTTEGSLDSLRSIHNEMGTIIKAVKVFFGKYENRLVHTRPREDFLRDLGTISGVLSARMDMEEKRLYPLYRP